MNKVLLKRYKKISAEIASMEQELEESQRWVEACYFRRDYSRTNSMLKTMSGIHHELAKRKVIREEILLPQNVRLENALESLQMVFKEDFILGEDGEWFLTKDGEDFLGEYLENYLVDNYNHCVYEFEWAIKGSLVYVNKIRWNYNQLLKSDLKKLLKNKLKKIELGDVVLIKSTTSKNAICVLDLGDYTLKETIKWLEDNYYL